MKYLSRSFLALLMVGSLVIILLTVSVMIHYGGMPRKEGRIAIESRENELIVNNSEIRLVFSGHRGYTLTELDNATCEINLVNYAAFYVDAYVTTLYGESNYYTDKNDNASSIDVLEYSDGEVIIRTDGRLVSSDGRCLDGVNVIKTYGILFGEKTVDVRIIVQFNSAPFTLNWLKTGIICKDDFSKWAYGDIARFNNHSYYVRLQNGNFSGENAYQYLLNRVLWMGAYSPLTNLSLTLKIADPEQFVFKSDENGTRKFGGWDGVHEGGRFSALEAFWSIPEAIKEGDFAFADLQLVVRDINDNNVIP
jgi:hypothetical protein